MSITGGIFKWSGLRVLMERVTFQQKLQEHRDGRSCGHCGNTIWHLDLEFQRGQGNGFWDRRW